MPIRIEISSETPLSPKPARIAIYDGEKLLAEVTANVERMMGADGAFYPCVALKKKYMGAPDAEK